MSLRVARWMGFSALALVMFSCDAPGVGPDDDEKAPAYALSTTGIDATNRTVVGFNKRGDIAFNQGGGAFRVVDGQVSTLDPIPGTQPTQAAAMNESGDVVGRSGNRAVRWVAASTAPVEPPAEGNRIPVDINDAGDVVFRTGSFSTTDSTAFIIWTAQGTLETLRWAPISSSSGISFVWAWAINNKREIAAEMGGLHTWWNVFSRLRGSPSPWSCEAAPTQNRLVAFNDSGAVITQGAGRPACIVGGDGTHQVLRTFNTSRLRFNNNFWMAGVTHDALGAIPVLAPSTVTVFEVSQLFESPSELDGWTIVSFEALNDQNEILAVATKGTAREFVVLKPRT